MGISFRTLKTMASKADNDNEDPSYFCSVVEEVDIKLHVVWVKGEAQNR